MAKELWKGNEAIAEAAIRAGCTAYFGYPITPQSEIPEYMSLHMPQSGGVFLQTESEVSTINMLYGAGGAGARVMTTTSSPGFALMQEGMGYLAGAQVPCVICNCMRGGPGLGTIQPAQGDYFQATRGGGNGDYENVVLAPSNMQEAVDMVQEAFDIADQYRNPCVLLIDGLIGQMMEPIEWHEIKHRDLPPKDWATTGRHGRDHHNIINSLYIDPVECNNFNTELQKKFQKMKENECRWEEKDCGDAEVVLVAYGTPARISLSAMELLREHGIKAGLFRPKTVWPYPYDALRKIAEQDSVKKFLVVEMSEGQMIQDVQLAVQDRKPIEFLGHAGGVMPTVEEIAEKAMKGLK
ncbi:3-methyl-2-oxobutanoate dehydrogenase subunit VorB [Eubacterium sp. F2]|uniref:3-methyl-2-oxobutanoate dehydrogenase subunit VorB n=1 Tax=Eubacterium sp. F2 TaxID=3381348 RepID=UPI00390812C4